MSGRRRRPLDKASTRGAALTSAEPGTIFSLDHPRTTMARKTIADFAASLADGRLFVLQGLPGVGPALAHRLLVHLGSVERVITADAATLTHVRGIGSNKAARIRELVGRLRSGYSQATFIQS
jgi:ERCC4-type nuclease